MPLSVAESSLMAWNHYIKVSFLIVSCWIVCPLDAFNMADGIS